MVSLARPTACCAQTWSGDASRRRQLRCAELSQIDEQLDVFADDADDQAIRALVSETPGASFEANDARKHADAMRGTASTSSTSIRELEPARTSCSTS